MATREQLLELIHHHGLSPVADNIERLMLPSVRIRARPSDDDTLPVGVSKFGGFPDLPRGAEWPHWPGSPYAGDDPDEETGPMAFLAQFRLSEVSPYDPEGILPEGGMLYFFAATWATTIYESSNEWHVLYYPEESTLARVVPPPELQDYLRVLPCTLEFTPEVILPPFGPELGCVGFTGFPISGALPGAGGEWGRYLDLLEQVEVAAQDEPVHRMLGYPEPVQGDMRLECIRMAHPEEKMDTPDAWRRWHEAKALAQTTYLRLLLQLDTIPGVLEWEYWGRGYFWITEPALKRRDFSKVCFVAQCT